MAGQAKAQAAAHLRERAALDRKIANLVEAISDGRSSPAIMAKLSELEAERARLGDLPPPPAVTEPALHPGIAELYAAKVRNLAAALAADDNPEALEAARALIDQVIVHPPDIDGDPPRVELIGELMALLKAGGLSNPQSVSQSATPDPVLAMFASSVKAAPRAEP